MLRQQPRQRPWQQQPAAAAEAAEGGNAAKGAEAARARAAAAEAEKAAEKAASYRLKETSATILAPMGDMPLELWLVHSSHTVYIKPFGEDHIRHLAEDALPADEFHASILKVKGGW